jgi:hypothetical protein
MKPVGFDNAVPFVVLGVNTLFSVLAGFIAYVFILAILKELWGGVLIISSPVVFAVGTIVSSLAVPVRLTFDFANVGCASNTFIFAMATSSPYSWASFAYVAASIFMASIVNKNGICTEPSFSDINRCDSSRLTIGKGLFFFLIIITLPACVIAPVTTLWSDYLDSTSGEFSCADPVAMMLNFVVMHELLPRDHIQYLALKYQLEIAVGVRPQGSPMTGEFVALRSFNESIMHYASRTVIYLLRGPHQKRAGSGGDSSSAFGQQSLSLVNLFGFMDPRNISRGTMDASQRIGFDYLEVARVIWSSINTPASGTAMICVDRDPLVGKPVVCHLFAYNEDGTVIAPGLEASHPDGDVWGLEEGPIRHNELDNLEHDEAQRRLRLAGSKFAKEAVEANITRLDNAVNGFVHVHFVSGTGG